LWAPQIYSVAGISGTVSATFNDLILHPPPMYKKRRRSMALSFFCVIFLPCWIDIFTMPSKVPRWSMKFPAVIQDNHVWHQRRYPNPRSIPMFVRWKKRQLSNEIGDIDSSNMSLYAVLVENSRIDGKTRQRVVKYLGYINEVHLSDTQHQERFWQQVMSNLDGMELVQSQHVKITAKLAEVVPKPSVGISYLTIPCAMTAGYLYVAA
jgi:hypothetical protein